MLCKTIAQETTIDHIIASGCSTSKLHVSILTDHLRMYCYQESDIEFTLRRIAFNDRSFVFTGANRFALMTVYHQNIDGQQYHELERALLGKPLFFFAK